MQRRLIILGALLALPLQAQENLFRQVPKPTHPEDRSAVQVDSLFSIPAPSGYIPIRVSITNQRKTDGKVVIRSVSNSGADASDSRVDSDFQIDSPAGSATTHDLLVPLTTVLDYGGYSSGSGLGISMTGSFGEGSGGLHANFDMDSAAVMMSAKLHTPNASTLEAELGKVTTGYGSPAFAGRFDPTRMPEDWRAYSGYDAFLMTDADWLATGAGARNALLRWCRLGGELVIFRERQATTFAVLGIDNQGDAYGFGRISLEPIPPTLTLDAPALVRRFRTSPALPPLAKSIREDYSRAWPLHAGFGQRKFAYGIFIVVLVGFGILVGPVNLFVFAKSGMRHKLFITTPIISLATSALLILLILIKDGTGGRGERIALIEVRPDSGENNAYVLQEQVSRTGVLLGGSFGIGESAAITPVPIEDTPWARLKPDNGGGGMRYTTHLRDGGLETSGDWFQSRSEQGQLIRSVIPTRGRIELKPGAGPPVLLSTFGFAIPELYYKDRSSGYWLAKDLKPGTPATCSPIRESDYRTAVSGLAGQLGNRHRRLLDTASRRADHYVAVTDESPAIETFGSIRWGKTRTILTGAPLR